MSGSCTSAAGMVGRLRAGLLALAVAVPMPAADAGVPAIMASATAPASPLAEVPRPVAPRLQWVEPPPFAEDIWEGAEPAELRLFVTMLPAGAPSPAMRSLMRRLLLSPAPGIEHVGEPSLLALRAAKLAELAMVDELLTMAAADPQFRQDEAASAALVDSLLLADRRTEACERVEAVNGRFRGRHWDNMRLVCLLASGRYEDAEDALAAMVTDDADPVFLAIAEALAAREATQLPDQSWLSLASPDAQLLTLLDLSDRAVSRAALRVSDPGRLMAIAVSTATPSAVRLDAAERVTASGAMEPDRLAELYGELPFTREELENALYMATRQSGPHIRALLEQTARSLDDPLEALQLRQHLVQVARGEAAPLAVMLALLDPIEPASRAGPIAVLAARSYYASGDLVRARAWHALARGQAALPGGGGELASVWPLAWLAGELGNDDAAFQQGMQAWLAAELDAEGGSSTNSAAVILATLKALGRPVDPALWHLLAVDDSRDPASLPMAPVWWRLDEAADAGHLGLTALLALVALGEAGPADAHPVLLERVLSSLVQVGLDDEARQLAREAIWAAQL